MGYNDDRNMPRDINKKNKVQDILVSNKRSIRDVELPSRSGSRDIARTMPSQKIDEYTTPISVHKEVNDPIVVSTQPPVQPNRIVPERVIPDKPLSSSVPRTPSTPPSYRYEYDEPRKSSRTVLYTAIFIFVVAAAFGISALFRGATVTVTPRHETRELKQTFTAKKDDTGSGLGFQTVTTNKDIEKTVPATGEQQVDVKASGTIIIFNNTTASQPLIATTRFQTPEGLIYKLVDGITVPARQVKNGKTVPGSMEVLVQAESTGDKYNVGLKDFTIPGFKGSSKYTQIFARSKTAMTGGFSGMQKTVDPEVLKTAETDMETELKSVLVREIQTQIPENFVLYESAVTYSLSPVVQVSGQNGSAVLKKKGTASAVIFDRGSLSRAVISVALSEATSTQVKVSNLSALGFSYTDGTKVDPDTLDAITFTLTGNADFIWVFDENKLKSDILGLSKQQGTTVISTYPSIQEAWIETKPFWNKTIPTDPVKVDLVNTLK